MKKQIVLQKALRIAAANPKKIFIAVALAALLVITAIASVIAIGVWAVSSFSSQAVVASKEIVNNPVLNNAISDFSANTLKEAKNLVASENIMVGNAITAVENSIPKECGPALSSLSTKVIDLPLREIWQKLSLAVSTCLGLTAR